RCEHESACILDGAFSSVAVSRMEMSMPRKSLRTPNRKSASKASSRAGVLVGVDIGGTFTDLVLIRGAHAPKTHKILTTPREPARAVLDGLHELLAREHVEFKDVHLVVHGTTLATNALIERKG